MSGRLGRSLGLDLLGDRICSMDCVYCEVGATKNLTCERKPYVPAEEILDELARWKNEDLGDPDMVTLGGLGEPCLNSRLGDVISGAKALFPGVPVAVLTNSVHLTDPQVREELALADVVLPSLDSVINKEYRSVNRVHKNVDPQAVREGLLEFRRMFDGKIFLEILLVRGLNDTRENLDGLIEFCQRFKPDRIDVVTMSRPGTIGSAQKVDDETLKLWRGALRADTVNDTAQHSDAGHAPDAERLEQFIITSLAVRPQTVEQLAKALHAPPGAVSEAVKKLADAGRAIKRIEGGETFWHGTEHEMH